MNKKWLPHGITAGALVVFIVLGLACASTPSEDRTSALRRWKNQGWINCLAAYQEWDSVMELLNSDQSIDINRTLGAYYEGDSAIYRVSEGTALMYAALYGKLDVLKALLLKGANINLRDSNGKSALNWAYDRGQMDAYNFLKGQGALEFTPNPTQSSGGQNSSSQSSSAQPSSQNYFVTVYFTSSGTRMSSSMAITAASKDAAEREAERQWKTINGWNSNLQFIEAVANW